MTQHFSDLENLYNQIDSDDCYLYSRSYSFEERVHNIYLEQHFESVNIRKSLTTIERENQRRNERWQIHKATK